MKKFELPEGITLLGFGKCKKCHAVALHIKGDPEAVNLLRADFEEEFKLGAPEVGATSILTGKPRLDA